MFNNRGFDGRNDGSKRRKFNSYENDSGRSNNRFYNNLEPSKVIFIRNLPEGTKNSEVAYAVHPSFVSMIQPNKTSGFIQFSDIEIATNFLLFQKNILKVNNIDAKLTFAIKKSLNVVYNDNGQKVSTGNDSFSSFDREHLFSNFSAPPSNGTFSAPSSNSQKRIIHVMFFHGNRNSQRSEKHLNNRVLTADSVRDLFDGVLKVKCIRKIDTISALILLKSYQHALKAISKNNRLCFNGMFKMIVKFDQNNNKDVHITNNTIFQKDFTIDHQTNNNNYQTNNTDYPQQQQQNQLQKHDQYQQIQNRYLKQQNQYQQPQQNIYQQQLNEFQQQQQQYTANHDKVQNTYQQQLLLLQQQQQQQQYTANPYVSGAYGVIDPQMYYMMQSGQVVQNPVNYQALQTNYGVNPHNNVSQQVNNKQNGKQNVNNQVITANNIVPVGGNSNFRPVNSNNNTTTYSGVRVNENYSPNTVKINPLKALNSTLESIIKTKTERNNTPSTTSTTSIKSLSDSMTLNLQNTSKKLKNVLKISNIFNQMTCQNVHTLFSIYGDVIKVKLTKLNKYFSDALIEFSSADDAGVVKEYLKGLELFGSKIIISDCELSNVPLPKANETNVSYKAFESSSSENREKDGLECIVYPSSSVIIKNISGNVKISEVYSLVSKYGKVKNGKFQNGKVFFNETGKRLVVKSAIIEMDSISSAANVIIGMTGSKISKRRIKVFFSKSNRKRKRQPM